ncbi:mandelate racemase/muconate lactonizing enzyme family protein [Halorussus marinus]|uniref:mandelate racemase/muconate lactonizing enzyme family protein n=1 Tax=Halorussus marinus TaxID=2505976 RepID=UPI00106DF723|nr:enolase C-terminal domain-like protein [Halorussus marinus]
MKAGVRPFAVPLAEPLDTARGSIERREGLVFRLDADDGAVGVGEATPLAGWTEHYDECERALGTVVDAVDRGAAPDDSLDALEPTPAARHALDLALADLAASRADEPLYRHLGASDRVESVPANATVGDAPADQTVAAVERAVDAGFDCVKLKVGARPLAADIERVEAAADAVDAALRADANGAWSRSQAQQFLDATADRLEYVEQPLPATDVPGLAALSGPIALDETLAAVDVADALDADPAALVLKPMALGGPRRAVAVAERAREAGVEPVVTTTVDAAVARTAAVHVAAAIPDPPACGLATAKLLESDLGPDIAPVADGRAVVPQGSGNGPVDAWGNAAGAHGGDRV